MYFRFLVKILPTTKYNSCKNFKSGASLPHNNIGTPFLVISPPLMKKNNNVPWYFNGEIEVFIILCWFVFNQLPSMYTK